VPLSRKAWFVVNTQPHKEALAIANLANQGFTTYCPLVRRRIRHARRSRDVLRPLFPGYVFVESAFDKSAWRPLLSTFGVRSLVRSGDEPSRLDPRFIEALRARENDGVIVAPASPYREGQQIRIVEGPFDGTVATILALDEKDRLIVLMDVLNRPVRVRLDARQISTA
jgi:transcriptional antiterminator RfaH